MGKVKVKKVHRCDYPSCNREFPRNYNLQVHRRVHFSTTPFKCHYPGCVKSFRWKSSLHCHFLTHKRKGETVEDVGTEPGSSNNEGEKFEDDAESTKQLAPVNPSSGAGSAEQEVYERWMKMEDKTSSLNFVPEEDRNDIVNTAGAEQMMSFSAEDFISSEEWNLLAFHDGTEIQTYYDSS